MNKVDWISVKKRLPVVGKRVLVYYAEAGIDVDYRIKCPKHWEWFRGVDEPYHLTHWAELPDPPEDANGKA